MKAKGAVICFQKYILGSTKQQGYSTPGGPICFGYMGRVDVQRVDSFKDYVVVASQHGAEYACTRKQLLTYQIDAKFDCAIDLVDFEGSAGSRSAADGKQPFCRALTGGTTSLCCCSVLNISQELAGATAHTMAEWLYTALEEEKKALGLDIDFAITGLLGGEDLCLILLSNQFSAISSIMFAVQKLTHPKEQGGCEVPVVDNSHSILMMDDLVPCDWGGAHAEISFSTKSVKGFEYLTHVCTWMKQQWTQQYGGQAEDISIEGCYGGYDTVIRCPAELLGAELYNGPDGLLSYDNPAYRNAAYQSETVVFPFGYKQSCVKCESQQSEQQLSDDLDSMIKEAIAKVTKNILGTDIDKYQELTYIKLALYRLLKDYRRVTAYPLSAKLRSDLNVQFCTAISAIVIASGSCQKENVNKAIPNFNEVFEQIVNELNSAMWMVGQCDRLSFDEQSSYLQNIGSYHKILLAYYGIIKDILRLLYSVPQNTENCQPVLVPLLSFGLTPIFNSVCYEAEYFSQDKGKVPAKLICIKLPYQALANPPKYLGILVHEVFHYLAPPRTDVWNQAFGMSVVRIAVCELISLLAEQAPDGEMQKDYGDAFQKACGNVLKPVVQQITKELFASRPAWDRADQMKLRNMFAEFLQFHKDPEAQSYQFFFHIWKNLRRQLQPTDEEAVNGGDKDADDAVFDYVFALDKGEMPDEEQLRGLFAQRVRAVPDFYRFRSLIKSCYNALTEVTADLFDVAVVLHGAERKQWAKQFFWQIYSTRCDILHGSEETETGTVQTQYARLLTNSIRIGVMMDYCLGVDPESVDRVGRFAEYLKEWCRDRKGEDRFARAQVTFRGDYRLYAECGKLYTDSEAEFCDMVCKVQEGLLENPANVTTMKKFSDYYRRYHELLDQWQAETISAPKMHDLHFDLCTQLLESYQNQETIQTISDGFLKAVPPEAAQPFRPGESHPWSSGLRPARSYAEYPEDLSSVITSAYRAMAVNGKVPVLWYRGQRNKHRETIPTIMRPGVSKDGKSFLPELRQQVHLAQALILPEGVGFTKAEWLAFLQHNEFWTNALDFSEEFYPALFFAIQRWIDDPDTLPEYDSHITMFNPVLFNLAMRALDERDEQGSRGKAFQELKGYLEEGRVSEGAYMTLPLFSQDELSGAKQFEHFYAWDQSFADRGLAHRPNAAMLPKNCERMKKQSGQYVFYDLRSKMKDDLHGIKNYSAFAVENLHQEYLQLIDNHKLPETPFMYEININRYAHKAFVTYAKAIGLRKYHVYPELDKLAKDLRQMLEF